MVEYIPPYDSPIENRFASYFVKYAADDIEMLPQYAVSTICGRFVLDFLLVAPGNVRVGIECDGREFHNASRDEWRDAMILGDNHVDVIYRMRGSDITYFIEDLLYLLQKLEPCLFGDRASANLAANCSEDVKRTPVDPTKNVHRVRYQNETDIGYLQLGSTHRQPQSDGRFFWMTIYKFAVESGGGDLDKLISDYRKQWKQM